VKFMTCHRSLVLVTVAASTEYRGTHACRSRPAPIATDLIAIGHAVGHIQSALVVCSTQEFLLELRVALQLLLHLGSIRHDQTFGKLDVCSQGSINIKADDLVTRVIRICLDVNAQQIILSWLKHLGKEVQVHLNVNISGLDWAVEALHSERSSSKRDFDGGVLTDAALARHERDAGFLDLQ